MPELVEAPRRRGRPSKAAAPAAAPPVADPLEAEVQQAIENLPAPESEEEEGDEVDEAEAIEPAPSPVAAVKPAAVRTAEPVVVPPEEVVEGPTFWDYIKTIPTSEWDKRYHLSLYRFHPRVENAPGTKKYISIYNEAISEEDIKRDHGGGGYDIYLKDTIDNKSTRRVRFWIDGEPIYIKGQRLKGDAQVLPPGGEQPAPAQHGDPAIAQLTTLLSGVIDKLQQSPRGLDEGMEILKKAMTNALDIQASGAKAQTNSATGNSLLDQLLPALLKRVLDPPKEVDPVADFERLERLAKIFRPERAAANETGELSFLKELIGVDSLKDMLLGSTKNPSADWKGQLVNVLGTAAAQLPALMAQLRLQRQEDFQRALQVENWRRNQGAAPAATPAATAPQLIDMGRPPQPASTAATPQPTSNGDAMEAALISTIANCWAQGHDGTSTALVIKAAFPTIVPMVRPLLADRNQVAAWVKTKPQLAEILEDEEWPDFLDAFLTEISNDGEQPARAAAAVDAEQPPA